VVYAGYETLKENDPVVPAPWAKEGPAELPPADGEVIAGTQYTCPMHPEVVQDKPGECPKCGMKLVPKNVVYTCPMHPEVREKEPGLCPKCRMKLQPDVVDAAGKGKPAPADAESAPAGTGAAAGKAAQGKYYCPMHPDITSDDPNATCPKCGGMKLQPRARA
jgi:Heavy metal binding domain